MNFDSKTKVTIDDVTFTLKKMTEGRRNKLRLAQADAVGRIRILMVEVNALLPTVEGKLTADVTALDSAKAETVGAAVDLIIDSEINPSWVRWGLDKIEGLTIDDEPATVESFIENAPSELFKEVLAAIRKEAEITPEERKNSLPLTTSAE